MSEQPQIVSARDVSAAIREWVIDEIKKAGDRYFELAKFFFGASAGSFAIIPFLGEVGRPVTFQTPTDYIPLLLLGAATLVAALMAMPISFTIRHDINLIKNHREFIRRQRIVAFVWMTLWAAGVVLLLSMVD